MLPQDRCCRQEKRNVDALIKLWGEFLFKPLHRSGRKSQTKHVLATVVSSSSTRFCVLSAPSSFMKVDKGNKNLCEAAGLLRLPSTFWQFFQFSNQRFYHCFLFCVNSHLGAFSKIFTGGKLSLLPLECLSLFFTNQTRPKTIFSTPGLNEINLASILPPRKKGSHHKGKTCPLLNRPPNASHKRDAAGLDEFTSCSQKERRTSCWDRSKCAQPRSQFYCSDAKWSKVNAYLRFPSAG